MLMNQAYFNLTIRELVYDHLLNIVPYSNFKFFYLFPNLYKIQTYNETNNIINFKEIGELVNNLDIDIMCIQEYAPIYHKGE